MPCHRLTLSATAHRDRLAGITTWRALLMLGGLLLHATTGIQHHPVMGAIVLVSTMFRMGCFFLISGLLTGGALIRRTDAGGWLRRRMVQIGVPTLFGIAVICPLTGVAFGAEKPEFLIYHLWFMVALIAYLLIGYAVHRLGGIGWRPIDRLDACLGGDRHAQAKLLATTALASFSLMLAGLAVTAQCLPARLQPLFAQGWLAAGYAPMFLLGVALARGPALRARFRAGWKVPVAILATVALVAILRHLPQARPIDTGDPWFQLMHVASMAAAPPAVSALMLRSVRAIRQAPVLVNRLSDASFTMYLVHYPLMIAIRRLLVPLGWGPWPMFAAMLIGGGGLAYLIWAMAARRSAVLSLLLAGRLRPALAGARRTRGSRRAWRPSMG